MLPGLMQHDHPLTTRHLAERMELHGGSRVIDVTPDGGRRTATYREVTAQARRLAAGLERLGVQAGDRVGTFAWNSREHLELYLAVPTMGAVLHTVNIRLHEDQTAWIINHAGDSVLFVDDVLVDRIAAIVDELPGVRHFVLIGGGDTSRLPRCHAYEDLTAGQEDPGPWPEVDDRSAAALCYTSGTTGDPRGVLYSHRSTLLHALCACATDTMAIGRSDRILLVVPMFHANAWGLPFAAMLTGADLIMPGEHLQPGALVEFIGRERATVAGAVVTLWTGMLRYADEQGTDLSSLRLALLGGGAAPESLVRAFRDRHGVRLTQAWGMTETSPIGAFCHPPQEALDTDEELVWRQKAGRVAPLIEARLIGDEGERVPHDGTSDGELEVRGPWIASGYYEDPDATPHKFRDGWLRTGDVATIDPDGFIAITDRSKDVIKSGGEWISSVQLEGHLAGHPDVLEAAVIARPDERWDERPVACVALVDGAERDPDALIDHLAPLVARWWLPDEVIFVDEVPKTSTGKFDKKTIRAQLADGTITLSPRRAKT